MSGKSLEELTSAVGGLRVNPSIKGASGKLKNIMTQARTTIVDLVKGTPKPNMNFHGDLLAVDTSDPHLDVWSLQVGLKLKGEELPLVSEEVDAVLGKEGFDLLLEDLSPVLTANKGTLKLGGPDPTGKMIQFTLSTYVNERKAA